MPEQFGIHFTWVKNKCFRRAVVSWIVVLVKEKLIATVYRWNSLVLFWNIKKKINCILFDSTFNKYLLAYLMSWKFKWARPLLNTLCPASVCLFILKILNSHQEPLATTANFKQTWPKAFLDEWNVSLFKEVTHLLLIGNN